MNRIGCVFKNQQAHQYVLRQSNALQRIDTLRKLKNAIRENEDDIYFALHKDLRKSRFEASVTELFFIYGEIDFAISNLRSWMSPKRIGKTMSNPFAKNRIYYEPKGVCLIIAPWNYPFQLVISPLISAISAGNCVMVKPSELSPATSKVIAKIILDTFEEEHIACIEGNADVSKQLLELPFDHIFFTGSTEIGKIVMSAAAKNLTSVTLELGGKSPTIVDAAVDLEKAAQKIAWGKLVNAGQTCIAPDYVLIHQDRLDEFVGLYKKFTTEMYFKAKEEVNPEVYGKIISKKHFERLSGLITEAVDKGARINWGGKTDEKSQTIYPAVLTQVPAEAKLMEEEIFGPILPIVPFLDIDEAIAFVNGKSKPLALYIFSNNNKSIKKIIKSTSAGGTCINDVLVHIANPKLPFGGANHSGMGSSHGFFGFKNFSHERTVVKQRSIDFNSLVYPPYHAKQWVLKLLKKIM
ncbi:MAG: aldehyde dehydrogenase family protein [Pedobacter sp.]|uniref:aldehyde dehydrogenase family protein n=1 Tax=Pedobacter sp. TaxID=1411316 RepID=UPI002808619A|nr:aldehyde dehydrogenase family protein [Pedobacter sp.]MDQ8005124.1 aldehyde dehydrogenase family protein [Pedobacter sp.]